MQAELQCSTVAARLCCLGTIVGEAPEANLFFNKKTETSSSFTLTTAPEEMLICRFRPSRGSMGGPKQPWTGVIQRTSRKTRRSNYKVHSRFAMAFGSVKNGLARQKTRVTMQLYNYDEYLRERLRSALSSVSNKRCLTVR